MFFYLTFFFILGTIVGSFLNVVILRYNTGLSFSKGRSQCFSCSHTLVWHDLVPLFSYLFLGGKCSYCKSNVSIQYPVVEFATGIIFSALFFVSGFSFELLLQILIFCILIVIFVYDLRHKIIPDSLSFYFSALALIFLTNKFGIIGIFNTGLLDFLAGPILFVFFASFWFVSKGQWMGLGDAKLALGVGWFLGLSGGIFAIIVAFWSGAIISLFLLGLQKLNISRLGLTIKSEIPFAPFILFGLCLQFFSGWTFNTILGIF
jgi:prepilin signal peptidase PulO-like enzyme (type II secretory pathway)